MKMTDRELLEYAAKAAGIGPLSWIETDGTKIVTNLKWNPLTNDGDAFRLGMLVKQVLKIELKTNHVNVIEDDSGLVITEDYNGDPPAATRRAIVRAVAEIGMGCK